MMGYNLFFSMMMAVSLILDYFVNNERKPIERISCFSYVFIFSLMYGLSAIVFADNYSIRIITAAIFMYILLTMVYGIRIDYSELSDLDIKKRLEITAYKRIDDIYYFEHGVSVKADGVNKQLIIRGKINIIHSVKRYRVLANDLRGIDNRSRDLRSSLWTGVFMLAILSVQALG